MRDQSPGLLLIPLLAILSISLPALSGSARPAPRHTSPRHHRRPLSRHRSVSSRSQPYHTVAASTACFGHLLKREAARGGV